MSKGQRQATKRQRKMPNQMPSSVRTILCVANDEAGPRGTDCPSVLHNWPLPSGYTDAAENAARRLRTGWVNPRCGSCREYGWRPGKIKDGADIERLP